ncbi:MAG: hypothetical protein ACRENH_08455 [Gemmatimonadaceae bacterium]
MALRDWSVRRILGIWTGWMAGLLVLLLAGVVLSPDGVTITVSGVGSSLAMRAAYGLLGLVAACLPPAAITYAWYMGRVREWGAQAKREAEEARRARVDLEHARRLAEGALHDTVPRQRQGMTVPRDKDQA